MILFPCHPLQPGTVEPDFEAEYVAAKDAGFVTHLFDFDLLAQGDTSRALRRVPEQDERRTAIYRGWMMKLAVYEEFHAALEARSFALINTTDEYRFCHWLPECYAAIEGSTPRTIWLPQDEINEDSLRALLRQLEPGPVIVKDYVKSRKHEWEMACFIPDMRDEAAALRVMNTFITRQGDDLNGGIVLREWVELESLGHHPRSKMPVGREFRTFWLDGARLCALPYWDIEGDADYTASELPETLFVEAVAQVQSRFWTMDVAQRTNGDWIIVELGDGQVSGLPRTEDAQGFYQQLKAAWKE